MKRTSALNEQIECGEDEEYGSREPNADMRVVANEQCVRSQEAKKRPKSDAIESAGLKCGIPYCLLVRRRLPSVSQHPGGCEIFSIAAFDYLIGACRFAIPLRREASR